MSHPPKALPLSLKETPPYPFIALRKKNQTSVGVCLLTVSLNMCAEQRASFRSCPLALPLPGKEDKRPCSTSRLNVLNPHRPLEGDLTRVRSAPHPAPQPRQGPALQTVSSCLCVFLAGQRLLTTDLERETASGQNLGSALDDLKRRIFTETSCVLRSHRACRGYLGQVAVLEVTPAS